MLGQVRGWGLAQSMSAFCVPTGGHWTTKGKAQALTAHQLRIGLRPPAVTAGAEMTSTEVTWARCGLIVARITVLSSSTSEKTLSSRAGTSTSHGIRPSTPPAFYRSEPYRT